MNPEPVIALIGFGEVGSTFGSAFRQRGVPDVRAHTRAARDARARRALEERLNAAGVRGCGSLAEAVAGASLVLSAVPASAAAAVASEAAGLIATGALYVDVTPASPGEKEMAAAAMSTRGARYVDAALMGTVVVAGAAVPMLACGPGVAAFAELAPSLGLDVSQLEGPAGSAARVKLLRSIYFKGRDALIVEMLLAARKYGVEAPLVASIRPQPEDAEFSALAARTLRSLAVHATRRAEELERAEGVLADAGVESTMTRAAAGRLHRLGALGLREHFGHRRPRDAETALDAMVALTEAGAFRAIGSTSFEVTPL